MNEFEQFSRNIWIVKHRFLSVGYGSSEYGNISVYQGIATFTNSESVSTSTVSCLAKRRAYSSTES